MKWNAFMLMRFWCYNMRWRDLVELRDTMYPCRPVTTFFTPPCHMKMAAALNSSRSSWFFSSIVATVWVMWKWQCKNPYYVFCSNQYEFLSQVVKSGSSVTLTLSSCRLSYYPVCQSKRFPDSPTWEWCDRRQDTNDLEALPTTLPQK